MKHISLFFLAAFAFTTPSFADAGGANLILPVAGRTAGAYGSEWYTDLVITNLKPQAASVFVTFYPTTGGEAFTSLTIGGWATLELRDVVGTGFEQTGIGMLRVNSSTPDARLTARAYVYNRGGNAGEYGQAIPAVPADALQRDHFISGLTKDEFRRTNAGIANPWPIEASLLVTLLDSNGVELRTIYPRVAPQSLLLLNDIFREFGMVPEGPASIRIRSNTAVYPYASIVRRDSGDAIFVAGSGVDVRTAGVGTLCSEPAALLPAEGQGAGDWIVTFDRNVVTDPSYVNAVLPSRHGFVIKHFYQNAFLGFLADLTPQQVAALRCEAGALVVQENAIVVP
ncbi:MAG TPA: hypothetical protein VFT12_00910 [Thermoanaerobaculia bacterium]|nr:hypothetical protein [Thermoanaerobaculia bacterium]